MSCINGGTDSAPIHVLERMKKRLASVTLKKGDQAWLVVDRDQWSDEHLRMLFDWSMESEKYGFALSNPKFEYWLLLHFEDGNGVNTSTDCSTRLAVHLPNYDKKINKGHFTDELINDAIRRARSRDNPPCEKWPRNTGTTVYKLVELILNIQNN